MSKRKLFYGTMNASKTAQLLMQAYNLESQGKSFAIFKPSTDSREYGYVKSRALSETRPAHVLEKDDLSIIREIVAKDKPDFLFADEFQFFTEEQIKEFSLVSIDFNIPVFAYGLMLSYTGRMFDTTRQAIECGFTLHELKMQCDYCSKKSTHQLLYVDGELIKDGDEVFIGDQEFKSVCYECNVKYRNKK